MLLVFCATIIVTLNPHKQIKGLQQEMSELVITPIEKETEFSGFKIKRIHDVKYMKLPEPKKAYDITLLMVDKETEEIVESQRIRDDWGTVFEKHIEKETHPRIKSWLSVEEPNEQYNMIYIYQYMTDSTLELTTTFDVLENWGVQALNEFVEEINTLYFEEQAKINKKALRKHHDRARKIQF